jgi:hypothetical protein
MAIAGTNGDNNAGYGEFTEGANTEIHLRKTMNAQIADRFAESLRGKTLTPEQAYFLMMRVISEIVCVTYPKTKE